MQGTKNVLVQILSEDVGADIEEEKQELLRAVPGVFDFKNYYAVKYQHSHIDALVARHPDQAETFSIGQTYEGREMKVGGLILGKLLYSL